MKHIKRIKIDIDKKNFKVIPSVQFDNARFLHINLVNGSMLFDLTGCSVKISGTKPDGTIIFNNCTIINEKEGFIEVELTEQINAVPGIVKCELKLYDGNGVLTTKNFDIEVSASATANGITSSNEFKALTDALKVVQGIDNKADKEKVEEKFGEVYEQLDDIANKGTTVEVLERVTKEEIDRQIADGTIANLTIAPGSITQDKLSPDIKFGIENLDNDVITRGNKSVVNLFDKNKGEQGWVEGGTVYFSEHDWTSDFIPCKPGEIWYKCKDSSNSVNTQNVAFYNTMKHYIGGHQKTMYDDWQSFVVPEGAYFFRFDMLAIYKDTEKIYGVRYKNVLSNNIKIDGANIQNLKVAIEDGTISPDKLNFVEETIINHQENILTLEGLTRDVCINPDNGNIAYRKGYNVTDYIEVTENAQITRNNTSMTEYIDTVFYDKDKKFISSVYNAPALEFTTPVGCKYIRTTISTELLESTVLLANKIRRHILNDVLIRDENIQGNALIYKDSDNVINIGHLDNTILSEKASLNWFDKNKGEQGWVEGGTVYFSEHDWTSDFIPCKPGEIWYKCKDSSNSVNTQNVAFYNTMKHYIGGHQKTMYDDWQSFVVPEGAYFFRFDMLAIYKDTEKIYKGTQNPSPHTILSDSIKVRKDNILGMIEGSIVTGDTGDKYAIGVDCRGNVYSKFINTEIPIVELDGSMEGISKDKKVTVDIKYRSKTKNFDGKCTLAWQGNGSVNYPKKNFKIKLTTKEGKKMNVGFRNWVPQDSYHLKANFTDSSHMRNIFMANLMHDVRKEDLPTGGRSTIDGFPVKVKINGKDQGIYTWNLKQSKEVYGLTKENPNHLMYRCEEHHGAGSFANISNIKTAWEDKFPETSDPLVATENRAKLSRMIGWVATADDATFRKDIHKYLNLNYLIDYWIYSVCFMAGDNLGRNMNLITYDGEVWYLTLYDLDTCVGNNYNGTPLPYDFKIPSQSECPNSVLFQKLRDNFKGEIINRYLELRNTAFATESLLTKIKEYMDFIGIENYQLDKQLWSGINTSTISYNYIANNIAQRLEMIDEDLTILTDGR